MEEQLTQTQHHQGEVAVECKNDSMHLPIELWTTIFSYLNRSDSIHLSQCNKYLYEISSRLKHAHVFPKQNLDILRSTFGLSGRAAHIDTDNLFISFNTGKDPHKILNQKEIGALFGNQKTLAEGNTMENTINVVEHILGSCNFDRLYLINVPEYLLWKFAFVGNRSGRKKFHRFFRIHFLTSNEINYTPLFYFDTIELVADVHKFYPNNFLSEVDVSTLPKTAHDIHLTNLFEISEENIMKILDIFPDYNEMHLSGPSSIEVCHLVRIVKKCIGMIRFDNSYKTRYILTLEATIDVDSYNMLPELLLSVFDENQKSSPYMDEHGLRWNRSDCYFVIRPKRKWAIVSIKIFKSIQHFEYYCQNRLIPF